MVIRETPKDIEHYIKVYDKDKIIKLGEKGFTPKYIDSEFAYFEYSKEIIDAIVDIIQWLGERGEAIGRTND